ncbi:hypothetical protein [Nostoc sp. NMS4]|nr:hypothetical protein [Nostoc sp. NMS4]MBN3924728.1 hypothetical protein [Nostoc sp. NMS4]
MTKTQNTKFPYIYEIDNQKVSCLPTTTIFVNIVVVGWFPDLSELALC